MSRSRTLLLATTMLVIAALAAPQTPNNDAITGIWRGEIDNVPAAVLNITDEAGPLQGAMLFYLVRRHPGKPSTSSPGLPEALFNPQFDGKKLTFQLSHRHAHANSASDPPVKFYMELTGSDEAKLVRVPQDGPEFMRMVREKR